MKLKNTTTLSDSFLRRMTGWVRAEVGLPAAKLRQANFTKTLRYFRGRAWSSGRILVRIKVDQIGGYPVNWTHRGVELNIPDAVASLVYVTAHEVCHLLNWHVPGQDRELREHRDLEPHCVRIGKSVMTKFLTDREALLATWNEPGKEREGKSTVSVSEKRAAKVQADLDRWLRKLKLAQTKVKKLKLKVGYYERKQAAESKIKPEESSCTPAT